MLLSVMCLMQGGRRLKSIGGALCSNYDVIIFDDVTFTAISCQNIGRAIAHNEAVLQRNSPPNKYYDYYYSVNGHEWVEWGVQVNLWNMGVFLQLVWKRRN